MTTSFINFVYETRTIYRRDAARKRNLTADRKIFLRLGTLEECSCQTGGTESVSISTEPISERCIMQQKKYPYNYNWRKEAPDSQRIAAWEGGAAYTAEKWGRPILIIDEGTMADFLFDDDQDLLDSLITILEFDSIEERRSHIQLRFSSGILRSEK
jgi:hypothetical protein